MVDAKLTRAELAELQRLEKAATKGPFEAVRRVDGKHTTMYAGPRVSCGDLDCTASHRTSLFYEENMSEADGDLIAALRNAAPQLLTAAELAADLAEEPCECHRVPIGSLSAGRFCKPCRARAMVTP